MVSKFTQSKSNLPGFTLLEVLVYVAVFAIVVGGSAAISVSVYRNKVIVEDRINLNEDFRLLNKLIRDDIYLGTDLTVTGGSSFNIARAVGNDIVYFLSAGRIYRQVGTGTPVVVTAATTDVLTFDVEDLSSPSAAETIRIHISLSNFDSGSLRPEIVQDVTTTFSIKFL